MPAHCTKIARERRSALSIDWLNTPLEKFGFKEFGGSMEQREDGTIVFNAPSDETVSAGIMRSIARELDRAYERLLPFDTDEEVDRYQRTAEVPVIRNGYRGYESLDTITLSNLPAILDTLLVLEEEHKQRLREEKERKEGERKERARVLAKERRRRKKIGAW